MLSFPFITSFSLCLFLPSTRGIIPCYCPHHIPFTFHSFFAALRGQRNVDEVPGLMKKVESNSDGECKEIERTPSALQSQTASTKKKLPKMKNKRKKEEESVDDLWRLRERKWRSDESPSSHNNRATKTLRVKAHPKIRREDSAVESSDNDSSAVAKSNEYWIPASLRGRMWQSDFQGAKQRLRHHVFETSRSKTEEDLAKYFSLMHKNSEIALMEAGSDFEKLELSDVTAAKLKEEHYKIYTKKAPWNCALCAVEFPNINLHMTVSRKAISDLRNHWKSIGIGIMCDGLEGGNSTRWTPAHYDEVGAFPCHPGELIFLFEFH